MEIIAYHEAGHAFMAAYLGAEVRSVTIEPHEDVAPRRSGETAVAWRRHDLGEREFRARAVQVALAGPAAEMLYHGDPYHPRQVREWSADWEDAWRMAALLHPLAKERLTYLERISIGLYRLLDREPNWSAVADLADQLLAHETLEAEQVREIVGHWLRR